MIVKEKSFPLFFPLRETFTSKKKRYKVILDFSKYHWYVSVLAKKIEGGMGCSNFKSCIVHQSNRCFLMKTAVFCVLTCFLNDIAVQSVCQQLICGPQESRSPETMCPESGSLFFTCLLSATGRLFHRDTDFCDKLLCIVGDSVINKRNFP